VIDYETSATQLKKLLKSNSHPPVVKFFALNYYFGEIFYVHPCSSFSLIMRPQASEASKQARFRAGPIEEFLKATT